MQPILLCVLGATAVGKTAAAIKLASQLGTEIISADSRQFYKEISIGTAKPGADELAMVKHHFIGHLSIHQTYTAGDFERDALLVLNHLFTQHRVVVAVGGSGLYVKALLDGLDDLPMADEGLRQRLHQLFEQEGILALQHELQQLNPLVYDKTDILNPQRIMRAIEIETATQQGFVSHKKKHERNFTTIPVVLNLPREILYERIDKRVDKMIASGLQKEAENMLPNRDAYALKTVGYTELFEHFDGKHDLQTAIHLIKQHSRNYAKRQLTWFRKQAPQHWFDPGDIAGILSLIK